MTKHVTYVTLRVTHDKPVADLGTMIAQRAYTLDGIGNGNVEVVTEDSQRDVFGLVRDIMPTILDRAVTACVRDYLYGAKLPPKAEPDLVPGTVIVQQFIEQADTTPAPAYRVDTDYQPGFGWQYAIWAGQVTLARAGTYDTQDEALRVGIARAKHLAELKKVATP